MRIKITERLRHHVFFVKTLNTSFMRAPSSQRCHWASDDHSAKDCRHRHFCDTCKGRYPTTLHDNSYVKERSPPEFGLSQGTAATSLSVTAEGSFSTSMVVPVWVSSQNNPTVEKLAYALLDSQSDTTFIDQELSDGLDADKHPVKLKLTTMSGKDAVITSVSGLCVRGYTFSHTSQSSSDLHKRQYINKPLPHSYL